MKPLSSIEANQCQYLKCSLHTVWISLVGSNVEKFEKAIQEYTGVKYANACMNETSAIQVSLNLSQVLSNDI